MRNVSRTKPKKIIAIAKIEIGGNQPLTRISPFPIDIPNVKKGGFTVLNTDQFTYYSFFHRINEQIRLRWTGKIRDLSYTLPPKTINRLALFARETKVELVLNKKGEFISSFVDQSSGAEFLDRATIDSFIEASPFLNPPQDLVDEDGFIRLNYSFFIEWKSRHLAKD